MNTDCSTNKDRDTLIDIWNCLNSQEYNKTINVLYVPSITLDEQDAKKIVGFHNLEERLLLPSLKFICKENIRLFYCLSQPLHPYVLEYYMEIASRCFSDEAVRRFYPIYVCDSAAKSLTQKILERPRLISDIVSLLGSHQTLMIAYNSTEYEIELAKKLGVSLFASDPSLSQLGTKSGGKKIFADASIPCPLGSKKVNDIADVASEIDKLLRGNQSLQKVVVKIDNGFIGLGNAVFDISNICLSDADEHGNIVDIILEAMEQNLRFQVRGETFENYKQRIRESGAIVEEFIEGNYKSSPSFQGMILPSGEVKVLSCQEQLFAIGNDHSFTGSLFPARESYVDRVWEYGLLVGEILSKKGALDCYSVDFIANCKQCDPMEECDVYALEINIRKGGTTHPFLILEMLTAGSYNFDKLFYSNSGNPKFYRSSDNIKSDLYRGLLPKHLIEIFRKASLLYNPITQKGLVFYLLSCLSDLGRFGMMSIADSIDEANELYDLAMDVLNRELTNLVE